MPTDLGKENGGILEVEERESRGGGETEGGTDYDIEKRRR